MNFCVCVAADCKGEKVNLRFFYHAKPSDREVIARATAAFTNYFTSNYVGHPFVVRMAVVFSELRGIWEHLKHPAQLHHNCQLYVFQPSTRDAPGDIQDPIDALPYLEGYMPPTGFATDLPFPPALRSPKPRRPTFRYYSPKLRDYCDSQEMKDGSWNTHATSSSREVNPAVCNERYIYPLDQEKRSTPVKNLNGDFMRVSHASPLREDGRSNSLEVSLSWPRHQILSKEVSPTRARTYSQRHLQAPLLSSGSLKSNVTSPSESLVVTITTFDWESQQPSQKVPGTRCGSSLYDGRRSEARLYSASGSREKSILRDEREKIDQQLNMSLDTMRVVLHEETAQMKKSVSPPRD